MEDYTTIRITRRTKEKLDNMNLTNMPISTLLEELVDSVGGYIVDDVVEITRDPVAFTLWQIDYDNPRNNTREDITFQDLRKARVRDEFYIDAPADSKNILQMEAEVIFMDDISVILRIIRKNTKEGVTELTTHLLHVGLF